MIGPDEPRRPSTPYVASPAATDAMTIGERRKRTTAAASGTVSHAAPTMSAGPGRQMS